MTRQNVYTTSAESNPSSEGLGLGESLGSTISDTPRTDAAAVGLYEVREDGYKIRRMVVDVELCEDIERENARFRDYIMRLGKSYWGSCTHRLAKEARDILSNVRDDRQLPGHTAQSRNQTQNHTQ